MRFKKRSVSRFALAILFVLLAIPAVADHQEYAVLFSGGHDQAHNFDYYYNSLYGMWDVTVNILGVDPSHVWVLSSDGTDPGVDRAGGSSSDWSVQVAAGSPVEAATRSNLAVLFDTLAHAMTADDSFYFWSFDHGGNSDPPQIGNSVLWGWNQEMITEAEFAAWTSGFNVKTQIYAFAECNASGMAYAMEAYPRANRFSAWSSGWDEPSFGNGWASSWEAGIRTGYLETIPLAIHARDYDIAAAFGLEHPGFIGPNIDLTTNEIVAPEPQAIILLATAIALLAGARRLRRGRDLII
jgi:hypothetical protein